MSIAAKLRLAATVPAVMALAFVAALVITFTSVASLRQDQASAIRIRTDMGELDQIVRAYLVRHDDTARVRYSIKDKEMRASVIVMSRSPHAYAQSAQHVAEDIELMRSLFERLVENHEAGDDVVLTASAEQRLATQLFIHSRDANAAAADLVQGITDETIRTQRRVYLLTTGFTIAAAILLTVGLLVLVRRINGSIAALTAGTEIIGEGRLDHRIGLGTGDEFGGLSDSFDRMAERLNSVTVSKTLLEQEIEERTKAETELRRAVATTEALLGAATAMASWTDLSELLEGLAFIVLKTTSHSRVTVGLWDDTHQELTVAVSAGRWPLERSVIPFDQLSEGMRQALTTGRSQLNDLDAAESEQRGPVSAFESHLSLRVPLRYRDRTVGVVEIDDPGERKEFSRQEMEIIDGIAAQAAVSVENARLFEASLAQLARTTVLKEAATAAHALDPVELSHSVLASFSRLLDMKAAVVYLLDQPDLPLRTLAMRGYDELTRDMPVELAVTTDSIAGTSVLTDEVATYRFEDLPAGTRQEAIAAGQTESTWAAIPVHVRDRVIGSVTFVFGKDRRFNADDIGLLSSLADQFGVALENARLYETERRIADRLQEALLSLPDRIPGIDFAHLYHSATESARVGGDFYDMFEAGQSRIGITIGDVAGKGLDAAVLTSLVKNTIRAHASDSDRTPGEVLSRTNDIVLKSTPVEAFVTAFFAIMDPAGRLHYSSAGHVTCAILRQDGSVERLPATGTILGAFSDAVFGEREAGVIEHKETLLLYTDGLTESRREGELYGEARLFALLSAQAGQNSPSALLRIVLDDVLAFSGGKLHDDLALMAVQRLPSTQDEDANHRTEVTIEG